MTTAPLLKGLRHQASGKVREIYGVDDAHLLLVTTDRISAFDVVLDDPIPGRGTVLTALTQLWLERTADLVPNHLVGWRASELPAGARHLPAGRCWCAGST
jgi:phosphoribosylaminoimidazole-succinocarboxamide synthase